MHTVVVVDDDVRLLKAFGRLLIGLGYRVELFASAQEFLNFPVSHRDTCVLLDCEVADVSGIEIGDQLHTNGSAVPIIFMTGSHDDAIRERALSSSGVAFLQKPFPEDALIAALGKAFCSTSSAGETGQPKVAATAV